MNKLSAAKLAATSALLAGLVVFSLAALPQQSGGYGACGGSPHQMRPGPMRGNQMGLMGQMPMMGGSGHMNAMDQMSMMGGDHMGMMRKYKRLDLTDEQQQQMRTIEHKLHKTHWQIMGLMIDEKAALREAYAVDQPNPPAVGAIYGKIFDLKRQMIEAMLAAENSSESVLTEEQKVKMKARGRHRGAMKGGMPGCGGMKRGQMMQGQTN